MAPSSRAPGTVGAPTLPLLCPSSHQWPLSQHSRVVSEKARCETHTPQEARSGLLPGHSRSGPSGPSDGSWHPAQVPVPISGFLSVQTQKPPLNQNLSSKPRPKQGLVCRSVCLHPAVCTRSVYTIPAGDAEGASKTKGSVGPKLVQEGARKDTKGGKGEGTEHACSTFFEEFSNHQKPRHPGFPTY